MKYFGVALLVCGLLAFAGGSTIWGGGFLVGGVVAIFHGSDNRYK